MASQGGNLALPLYEDVMRSMESALRQQTQLTRGPHHTLVMEAVKAPTSSATRVTPPDPANIEKSIPVSERSPITLRRTTSITMASRQSAPSIPDDAPESERPESTILLVTIEELEAEAQGPATERIPQAMPDRSSGIQLVPPHPSAPPPPMPPMMMATAQAFAPPPPAKKSAAAAIAIVIVAVLGLLVLVAAGAQAIRARRAHGPSSTTAGIHAPVAPTSAPTPATTETSPAANEPGPPPPVVGVEAKPEESSGRVAVGPKRASARKKSAKRAAMPVAAAGEVEAPNDDPGMLLDKGLDPATEL